MNEQDKQTVERVAAAMADADAQVLENLQPHIAGAYRRRARAAISAMPDTTAQADTIKALTEAIVEAHDCMDRGCDADAWGILRDARKALSAAKETEWPMTN